MAERIQTRPTPDGSKHDDHESGVFVGPETSEYFGNLSEEEIKAWKHLVPAHRQRAIDPNSFQDLFDPASIEADLAYVGKIEAEILKDTSADNISGRRRGELLEALVFWQIRYAKWFGAETDAIPVSRYDDIVNGVDLVAQFIRESGFKFLAITIDVTSSPTTLSEKLGRIKKDILAGKLSRIKYFDPDPQRKKQAGLKIRGELRDVPRVVVGIDNKALRELSLLKIEISGTFRGSRDDRNSQETRASLEARHKTLVLKMINHRIQVVILEQIQMQLRTFSRFARLNNQEGLASQYENDLAIIEEIFEEKMKKLKLEPEDFVMNHEDSVFKSLRLELKNFE